ncbi:MAG: histidine phosphatase family protein [Magnetovibrionaceae bacterium]
MKMLRPLSGLSYVLVMAGFCLASALIASPLQASEQALWSALKSGEAVAMIRHALAPGTGDPENFRVDDCATQRNLDQRGRDQARVIGQRFRDAGIARAKILSSAWCRCLETADIMDLGPVENLPALNSFFRKFERREPQTRALRAYLKGREAGPLVLVTHQVNITALTDVFPQSGEIIVVRPKADGSVTVMGRLPTAVR